jgi:hypothetical protein
MDQRRIGLVPDLLQLADLVQVEPGGEVPLAARENYHVNVLARGKRVEQSLGFLQHIRGKGIAFLKRLMVAIDTLSATSSSAYL